LVAVSIFMPLQAAPGDDRNSVSQNVSQEIVLQAAGPEGGRLEGDCIVKNATGEQIVTIAGALPLEKRFAGAALSCRLSSAGIADIEVRTGGNLSRTRTSGGTVRFSIGS